MKVLIVEPKVEPYELEVNELHEMQSVVGGHIEAIYPFKETVAVVCNAEGRLRGLPFNRSMEGGYGEVYGTFFVCGLSEEDFCSLTEEQIGRYKEKFHFTEVRVQEQGGGLITLPFQPEKHHSAKPAKPKGKNGRNPPGRGRE